MVRLPRRHVLGLLSSVALMPGLAGMARAQAAAPRIVATTGMIADMARRISGGEVQALLGPGLDPHSYRQTRSDIAALAQADLVLWHGLYLEAQMEEFLLDLASRKPVLAVGETVAKDRLIGDPQYADRFDPHIWFDPDLWAAAVDGVQKALDNLTPAAAATHAANAAAYRTEAAAVGAYAREVLASVPPEARVLVTAHDAFGYFGRAYDFEVEGIQGLSTESEAGLKRIEELVQIVATRKVRAVFFESSVPDRNVRALVEGAAARGHRIVVGGELYSDALGKPGTYEGTLIGMLDHNVTTIARALGGDAPDRGMAGRLRSGG